MKKINKALFFVLLFFPLILAAQTTKYYEFEGGDECRNNDNCLLNWHGAGSPTFRSIKRPYRIVNAIRDLKLKTDGSDNASALNDFLYLMKTAASPEIKNALLVIYFPTGTYYFRSIIKLDGVRNVIFKGNEYDRPTLEIDHPAVGFSIKNGSSQIGIEDLNIERANGVPGRDGQSESSGVNMWFSGAHDCWVSGVNSHRPWAGHIVMAGASDHITISGCTFESAQAHGTGGEGYGVIFQGTTYQSLLENSLFYNLRHSILFQQNPYYNVIAYNASYDPYFDEGDVLGVIVLRPPDLAFHGSHQTDPNTGGPGPHHNLIEGNSMQEGRFDISHGSNGPHNTFVRTRFRTGFSITEDYADWGGRDYFYFEYNQHHQNLIGTAIATLSSVNGTIKYSGDALPITSDMPDDVVSYYTWDKKPDYLASGAWPYKPASSVNAAEIRQGGHGVDPEGWKRYYCGRFMADQLTFDQGQTIGPDYNDNNPLYTEYRAITAIDAGPATITGPAQSEIKFLASNNIDFNPGFETTGAVNFTAQLVSNMCPSDGHSRLSSVNDDEVVMPILISSNIDEVKSKQPIINKGHLFTLTPNPFYNEFTLHFTLTEASETNIIVYNSIMQPVLTFIKKYEAGEHEMSQYLDNLPSGLYTVSFNAGNYSAVQKVVKL